MPTVSQPILPAERLDLINARIDALTGGADVQGVVRNERIAKLRDPDKNTDLTSRLEIAYLIKSKVEILGGSNRAVETVIAGNPTDAVRRVFARVATSEEHNGLTYDL